MSYLQALYRMPIYLPYWFEEFFVPEMSSGMWDKSPFNVTASLMGGQCCLYHKFIYMLLHFFILFLVSYCLLRVSVLGRWSPPFLDALDTVIFACGDVEHAQHVHTYATVHLWSSWLEVLWQAPFCSESSWCSSLWMWYFIQASWNLGGKLLNSQANLGTYEFDLVHQVFCSL